MNVSLIIPAYNEEERIVPFLQSIAEYCKQRPGSLYEVIVVDDGSKDKTAIVAKEAGKSLPNLQVMSLNPNQGKGGAIRAGVLKAAGDYIVFMDADGATGIEELPKMMTALEGSDIAVGNRWIKGSETERHSLLRQLSGFSYRNYMKLFGLGSIDTMCGFKGYKKEVAKDLYKDLQEMRWLFDTEIAYRAVRRGYKIKNFPIMWESKDGSKLDTVTLIKSALQIFPLIGRIRKEEAKISA
jgi:dolichyl-phosphate beta-glucosyltransferase